VHWSLKVESFPKYPGRGSAGPVRSVLGWTAIIWLKNRKKWDMEQIGARPRGRCDTQPYLIITDYRLSEKRSVSADEINYLFWMCRWSLWS